MLRPQSRGRTGRARSRTARRGPIEARVRPGAASWAGCGRPEQALHGSPARAAPAERERDDPGDDDGPARVRVPRWTSMRRISRDPAGPLESGRAATSAVAGDRGMAIAACGSEPRTGSQPWSTRRGGPPEREPTAHRAPARQAGGALLLLTTLVRYDSALVPRPYLARAWTWSADQRSLIFRLQSGTLARWHADNRARRRLDDLRAAMRRPGTRA